MFGYIFFVGTLVYLYAKNKSIEMEHKVMCLVRYNKVSQFKALIQHCYFFEFLCMAHILNEEQILMTAIRFGSFEMLEYLVQELLLDYHKQSLLQFEQAIFMAMHSHNKEILKFLLYDCPIEYRTSETFQRCIREQLFTDIKRNSKEN
jgi:hypothetical protein